MKTFFLLIASLFMSVALNARYRTDEQMASIAKKQLQLEQEEIKQVIQAESYSVYSGKEGGFVVVSRNADRRKVLGYSSSSIDSQNIPDGLEWWLRAIASVDVVDETTNPSQLSYESVPNFVTARWGQGMPYNMLCPKVGGKRSWTGCVATALAQALYYYKYPLQSSGDCTFYLNGSGPYGSNVDTTYNWNLLMDYYDSNDTDDGAKSVALLLRNCGFATCMNYSSVGSAAYSYMQAVALTDNFGFEARTIRYADRNYYSDEEWMTIVYQEILSRRPVLYTGLEELKLDENGYEESREGHSFLITGMDSEGRLYVNWGWDGAADGFFDFSDLAPRGLSGDDEELHFNFDQEMVFGITPDTFSSSIAPKYSEFSTGNSVYTVELDNNELIVKGSFYNIYYSSFKGALNVVLMDENENQSTYSFLQTGLYPAQILPRKGIITERRYKLNKLDVGKYKVYMVSMANDDEASQLVRCPGGPIFYELTKFEDGSCYLSEPIHIDYRYFDEYTQINSIRDLVSGSSQQTWYSLGGMRQSAPQRGVSIVRQGETVKKIFYRY